MKEHLKRIWYRWLPDHPYSYVGRVLIRLCPSPYLTRIQEDFLINPSRQSSWRKIIKAGLRWRYFSQDEAEVARINRAQFWGGIAGRRWHQMKATALADPDTFREEFEEFRAPIVNHVSKLLQSPASYTTLCEIGTGNGLFLQYLSRLEELKSLKQFVGLDLNPVQIEDNRKNVNESRLSFQCMEVGEWIATYPSECTIFLTHETLHNFTPAELARLFDAIGRVERAAVVLSEPIDQRLPVDVLSKPRGGIGISFSHNYVAYLRRLGYAILADVVIENRYPLVASYDHRLVVACRGLPNDVTASGG